MQRGRAENMTKCFIKHCDGKAKYTIKDAEQHPKKYNGKKICPECYQVRKLLKAVPKEEQDDVQ